MLRDIRIAFRLFLRAPALTAVALLSIALSVGATAVVFTAIKAVLLDPLPYSHPERLVQLRTDTRGFEPSRADWMFRNDLEETMRRTRTLESAGFYANAVFDLGGGESAPPEALYGVRISASLFPTLGVSPVLGRNIWSDEDQPGHANEIILSDGVWTRRFNRDRGIVGQSITINGHDCLVIGVMPPGFNFPLRRGAAHTPYPYVEFWAPIRIAPDSERGAGGAVARLRPGVSVAQAQQDLAIISADLARRFPASNRDRVLHLGALADRAAGTARPALWLLFAAALLFLLIGCANVANLLLARGLSRQREFSVRAALGAARFRMVRQLLIESCLLAAIGGAMGYAIAVLAWKALPSIAPLDVPRLIGARADGKVLVFSLAIALANGILFGIAPALRSAFSTQPVLGRDLNARTEPATRDRLRFALIAAEVAITVALVLAGGSVLKTFIGLLRTDPGFDARRVLASVVLPARERYPTPDSRAAVYRRFLSAVRSIPGVQSAGTVDALPFSGENHGGFISANRRGAVSEIDVVGGDYLEALGARLLAGRRFDEGRNPSDENAIVSETTARRLWPGENAIGKTICVDCAPENPKNWKRVIGVVSDLRHASLEGGEPSSVYLSTRAFEQAAFLVVRTDRPPAEMDRAIRRAIASIDPDQPVLLSAQMQSLVADSLADRRFIMILLAAMACLAILLSLAGIYGVTRYAVARRTREIGIRIALGAMPRDIQALVFSDGFRAIAAGLAIGAALSILLLHVARAFVAGMDGVTASGVLAAASLVALVSAIACWFPTRRATRADPMIALREE